ncbi:hypothetical protein [Halalkalibacter hemicellulosilyticus]|uniref:Uncharacterized protein n=1 Tax=Halalkalibacter hemicellulosilyticusJCM 9152 TaxID=1236971 RepID=W4QFT6_9BACI|nr:hypothetical protein [Halalkalibacter hemicellulosilyticus]GAE30921.1 hypothetical protein JCM9152_2354 [Halalkalibacter hemicellulosilyticusJCM 9152]
MQYSKEELEQKLQYYKETLQSLKAGTLVDDYFLLKEELTIIRENQTQYLKRMDQLEELINNHDRNKENENHQLLKNEIELQIENLEKQWNIYMEDFEDKKWTFQQAVEKMEQELELKVENDSYKELLKRVNEMEGNVRDRLSNQEQQLRNIEDKLEKMEEYVEKQNELAEKAESDEFTQTIAKRSSSDYKKLQQLISSSGQQEEQQSKTKWSANSPMNKALESNKTNEKTALQSYFPPNSKGFQKHRDTRKENK